MEIVADKRGRRQQIPDVAMPPEFAHWVAARLSAIVGELRKANTQPNTATGTVERLALLERAIDELKDLRSILTAWTVEDAAVTLQIVAERTGRSGTTVGRRYDEGHVQRLRAL